MKEIHSEKYSNTYKFDKISDYFKFIITAQIAILGFLLTAIEKVKLENNLKWLFPLAAILLAFSLALALYGKIVLLRALFKEKASSDKVIKYLATASGLTFFSIILTTVLKLI